MKQILLKTWLVMLMMCVGVGAWAADVTSSVTMTNLVAEKEYTVSEGSTINTKVYSIDIDANINVSLTAASSGNSGSFWGATGTDWRLYQGDNPVITVAAKNGATLSKVKFTYGTKNSGVINTTGYGTNIDASAQLKSGTAYNTTGNSATYYVGNSSTKTNGQAQITAIEVTYTPAAGSAITYKVTFNAGFQGTCSTNSLTETSEGSGVTLPSCTPSLSNYTFAGWATSNNPTSANAGAAGASYKPKANTTLYAYYTVTLPTYTDSYVDFDLTTDNTTTATDAEMTWTNENVNVAAAQNGGTKLTNYYPGTPDKTYTSTRFYKNNTLTFTPASGKKITGIVFTSTTNPYAAEWGTSSCTNGTIVVDYANKTVCITPTDTEQPVSVTFSNATGGSKIRVYYSAPVTKYDVTIVDDIENGSVTADPTTAAEGETVTLNITPNDGYTLAQLMVTNLETDDEIDVVDNEFVMPAADVEVYAYFAPASNDTYTLSEFVENAEDIEPGSMVSVSFDNEIVEIVNDEEMAMIGLKDGDNTFTLIAETQFSSDWSVGGTLAGTWDAMYYGQNPMNGTYMLYYVDVNDPWAGLEYTAPAAPTNGTLNFVATTGDGKYYATFSSDRAIKFDEVFINEDESCVAAIKAYAVTVIDGQIYRTDQYSVNNDGNYTYVPANTGILFEYTLDDGIFDGTVPYEYADAEAPYLNTVEDNDLRPASVAMTGDYMYYKLAYGNWENKSNLGFFWGEDNGAAFECKEGTAYLAVAEDDAPHVKGFKFSDFETGINKVVSGQNKVIYNLNGQKMSKLQMGVNIVNGKKLIIK